MIMRQAGVRDAPSETCSRLARYAIEWLRSVLGLSVFSASVCSDALLSAYRLRLHANAQRAGVPATSTTKRKLDESDSKDKAASEHISTADSSIEGSNSKRVKTGASAAVKQSAASSSSSSSSPAATRATAAAAAATADSEPFRLTLADVIESLMRGGPQRRPQTLYPDSLCAEEMPSDFAAAAQQTSGGSDSDGEAASSRANDWQLVSAEQLLIRN